MDIIKEHCGHHIVIRKNNYGLTVEDVEQMFDVAEYDFPGLIKDDVKIVHYAGNRYAKTFGIEFDWKEYIPDDYIEIYQLEYTK